MLASYRVINLQDICHFCWAICVKRFFKKFDLCLFKHLCLQRWLERCVWECVWKGWITYGRRWWCTFLHNIGERLARNNCCAGIAIKYTLFIFGWNHSTLISDLRHEDWEAFSCLLWWHEQSFSMQILWQMLILSVYLGAVIEKPNSLEKKIYDGCKAFTTRRITNTILKRALWKQDLLLALIILQF